MIVHAYHEMYLNSARRHLGETLDYAVNTCEIEGNEFIKMFLVSQVSKRLENGEPNYLVGKSGIELAIEVYRGATGKELDKEEKPGIGRSVEYWIGWAVAYYQWYSCRKYREIFKAMPYEDLKRMYLTLHEADISKFVEIAEQRVREAFPETSLKRIRTMNGYSQAELARRSGVSLRSIQMYEQRQKDINKASTETVYRLAKFLGCSMEDLVEL